MSLGVKIVLGIIVVGGIVWAVSTREQSVDTMNESRIQQPDLSVETQLSTGQTNTDLDADLKAVDRELSIISSTSADIDTSINDTSTLE